MKTISCISMILFSLTLLSSCMSRKVRNPEFDLCSNDCVKAHNACITSATSSAEVDECKNKMKDGITACEINHPRMIERSQLTK